ncbi:hypothetical protein MesoLj131c_63470 [Mesorhizobium sp. 131-3-5]|nr:hypothetical protein MesoLj131c_63470 [Mesorhizobium sp. 131-3-5]
MTKLSDLGPPIPGKRHGAEPAREEDNSYPCPNGGQKVDQRGLRQVLYHEGPWHDPLEPEPEATIIKFSARRQSK